jgi:hypothetical protein
LSGRLGPLLAAVLLLVAAPGAADDTRELLRRHVELIRAGAEVTIGRDRIASTRVLPSLYEQNDFSLAWTRRDAALELFAAVVDSQTHGLDPDDYHRPELERLLAHERLDVEERVDLDLLLTDALVRLVYHLVFGKVDAKRSTHTGTSRVRSTGKRPSRGSAARSTRLRCCSRWRDSPRGIPRTPAFGGR